MSNSNRKVTMENKNADIQKYAKLRMVIKLKIIKRLKPKNINNLGKKKYLKNC